MVIPWNDYFICNGDPMGREVFDVAGVFVGGGVISIFGGNVWDAGTEVSDGSGAAFSTAGGVDADQGGVVGRGLSRGADRHGDRDGRGHRISPRRRGSVRND
jgi:hypothetical protein